MGKSASSRRSARTTTRKKTSATRATSRSKKKGSTSKRKATPRKSTGGKAIARGKRTTATPLPKVSISNYSTAVRYLYERVDFERMRIMRFDPSMFKLDRMRTLLAKLGDPQEQIKTVHVAGTVGKGSTVAMLASMLKGCDYAVGTYTSPHLMDVRERITINGRKISKPDFTQTVKQVSQVARRLGLEPTFFELMTATAFKYFAEQAVDIAVIEVGLGGRLDSTNVITPLVSLITTIDYDHTQILGSSLTRIAQEKAGIIKRGVPALSFEQHEVVEQVLRDKAEKVGAPFKIINKDIEYSSRFGVGSELGPHTRICLLTGREPLSSVRTPLLPESGKRNADGSERGYMHIPVPLPGEHQAGNCALALAAIDVLRDCGFEFPETALHEGLAQTHVPGRMELVAGRAGVRVPSTEYRVPSAESQQLTANNQQPKANSPKPAAPLPPYPCRVLVDGAHNASAVSALMRCVGVHVPYDSMVCIFGCCEDKDISKMLDSVALGADKVIFTRAKGNARAADPVDLQREFQERSGKMNQVAKSLPEALHLASRAVGRDDLICITGSFYLTGEAKRHFADMVRKPRP